MADILEARFTASIKLDENSRTLFDQFFDSGKITPTYVAGDRIVLGTSMASPQQLSLGDIGSTNPGKMFFLKTDQPIKVGIDQSTTLMTLGTTEQEGVLAFVGSFQSVYVQNESAVNKANIMFLAVG